MNNERFKEDPQKQIRCVCQQSIVSFMLMLNIVSIYFQDFLLYKKIAIYTCIHVNFKKVFCMWELKCNFESYFFSAFENKVKMCKILMPAEKHQPLL